MWPDRVSNPGPLTYESGALPTALRGLAAAGSFPFPASLRHYLFRKLILSTSSYKASNHQNFQSTYKEQSQKRTGHLNKVNST